MTSTVSPRYRLLVLMLLALDAFLLSAPLPPSPDGFQSDNAVEAVLAVEGFLEWPPTSSGTREKEEEAEAVDKVVHLELADATLPSARRRLRSSRRSSRRRSARAMRR